MLEVEVDGRVQPLEEVLKRGARLVVARKGTFQIIPRWREKLVLACARDGPELPYIKRSSRKRKRRSACVQTNENCYYEKLADMKINIRKTGDDAEPEKSKISKNIEPEPKSLKMVSKTILTEPEILKMDSKTFEAEPESLKMVSKTIESEPEKIMSSNDSLPEKELTLEMEDFAAIRRYLAAHSSAFVKEKFDSDEMYRNKILFALNPLVTLKRCPRITQMLKATSPMLPPPVPVRPKRTEMIENRLPKWCREYSPQEDQIIITWVRGSESRAQAVNGNQIWQRLAEEYPLLAHRHRSWHSLRNRYLRYILPSLGHSLSPHQAQKLRAAAARGTLKSRKRVYSDTMALPGPPKLMSASARGIIKSSRQVHSDIDAILTPNKPKSTQPNKSPTYSDVTRKYAYLEKSSFLDSPAPPVQSPVTRSHGRRLYNLL